MEYFAVYLLMGFLFFIGAIILLIFIAATINFTCRDLIHHHAKIKASRRQET